MLNQEFFFIHEIWHVLDSRFNCHCKIRQTNIKNLSSSFFVVSVELNVKKCHPKSHKMSLTLCCISFNGAHKNRIKISREEKHISCKTMMTIAAVKRNRNELFSDLRWRPFCLNALKFHFHGKHYLLSQCIYRSILANRKRASLKRQKNKQFK